jgi:hypothetical protein
VAADDLLAQSGHVWREPMLVNGQGQGAGTRKAQVAAAK